MRNAEGYRNHWFGVDAGRQQPLGLGQRARRPGGDNYGSFGGGTPNCNSAHGSPPTYNGVWGSPPPPSPRRTGTPRRPRPRRPARRWRCTGIDADQDNVPAGTDCDDFEQRSVYPGAPEVLGDGRDQDCNGADAAGRVSALVAFRRRTAPADRTQVHSRCA